MKFPLHSRPIGKTRMNSEEENEMGNQEGAYYFCRFHYGAYAPVNLPCYSYEQAKYIAENEYSPIGSGGMEKVRKYYKEYAIMLRADAKWKMVHDYIKEGI